MGIRIWLDDVRNPPPGTWVVHRSAEETLLLIESGLVTFIDFDHDLGPDRLTGYDVAKKIEQLAHDGKIPPIEYSIHSGNPVGANNIDRAMKSAWRFWDQGAGAREGGSC